MDVDIGNLLKSWQYDPEQTVRLVSSGDGRMLLQVRLPLGLEQYEMDGRPDGYKPHGYSTFLEYLEEQKLRSLESGNSWTLDSESFKALQQEGILMYYRYVVLYQINDFARVVRDTDHNLLLCDMLEENFPDDDRYLVLQFRPFILRMNATARAYDLLQQGKRAEALRFVEKARERIENLGDVPMPAFSFEKARSITMLDAVKEELIAGMDKTELDLESALEKALADENYEEAARLRDSLRARQEASAQG